MLAGMPKLRAHNISMSVDGFMAGPDQSLENPLGVGGAALHEWVFATRSGRKMIGEEGGAAGLDDDFFVAGETGIGATVMGRNMFGPIRGEWPDDEWKGWWGDDPPYHHPVFVLTHHARDPLEMAGGTTFHFVTDGPETALQRAFEAAGGRDVRLGGGASTIQQYLRAGLLDELHVAIAPTLLGAGERLFPDKAEMPGYACDEIASSAAAAHAVFRRQR
jgi:dihydrofolate reductase